MKGKPINKPFLPEKKVTAVVMAGRISQEIEHKLRALGIDIVKTPFCKELYPAIAYHPDILMHPVSPNTIVIAPNVHDLLKPALKGLGFVVVKGESTLTGNYPGNIAYNIGRIGKYAVHNFKYTDRIALEILEEQDIEPIEVKQGYSKCSICVVSEQAVITADRGIQKALEKKSIDVLRVSSGYIDLPGLDYGFIGGTSGLLSKNLLAFTGDLKYHPDYISVINFLSKHQVESIPLDKFKLVDFGSIVPLLQMP